MTGTRWIAVVNGEVHAMGRDATLPAAGETMLFADGKRATVLAREWSRGHVMDELGVTLVCEEVSDPPKRKRVKR